MEIPEDKQLRILEILKKGQVITDQLTKINIPKELQSCIPPLVVNVLTCQILQATRIHEADEKIVQLEEELAKCKKKLEKLENPTEKKATRKKKMETPSLLPLDNMAAPSET